MEYPRAVTQSPDLDVSTLTVTRKRLLSTVECMDIKPIVHPRKGAPLSGNTLLLNDRYDYVLIENELGKCCLLPLHKE